MNDLPTTILPVLHLPMVPEPRPLDRLLSSSGSVFMAVYDPHRGSRDASTLRGAIADGDRLMAAAATIGDVLSEATKPEGPEKIGRELAAFVEAWPNASRGDLTVYGGQLALDVIERQPCRYALRSALRHLRQTSRFLPSIAEVLAALDGAQTRTRNTIWHLRELPAALERARADLVRAEAFEAHRSEAPLSPAPEAAP